MGTPDQTVPVEAGGGGKYISLATDLKPEPLEGKEETTQSKLLERWTKTQAVAQNKVFRLGSEETVVAGIDKGGNSSINMINDEDDDDDDDNTDDNDDFDDDNDDDDDNHNDYDDDYDDNIYDNDDDDDDDIDDNA